MSIHMAPSRRRHGAAIETGARRDRSWVPLLAMMFAAALVAVSPCATAATQVDCGAEAAELNRQAKTVRWEIVAPDEFKAGQPFRFNWRAEERFSSKTPVYLVLSVPGEVRFEADSVQIKRDEDGLVAQPALPGFLALPGGTRAPLGIQFGESKSRALIPLYQPGSTLTGSFAVQMFDRGQITLEAALVAHTTCGERTLSKGVPKIVTVNPGTPEIVVQDPYDVAVPKSALVSNDGRYLAQIFEGRYRIFDTRTGAKLVDHNGHNPNFSPTSRFVVADIGDFDGRDFEVIDLVSREVIATPVGRFVGWAHGDAFLIDGRGDYGTVTLRPTLISRPKVEDQKRLERSWAPEYGAAGLKEDALSIRYDGSCHACGSWSDTSISIDLDNAVVLFSGTFASDGFAPAPIYELASGHSGCCKTLPELKPYAAANYEVEPFDWGAGWRAREQIQFSHIFDPSANAAAADKTQDWYRAALALGEHWRRHRQIDPKTQARFFAGPTGSATIRGDWRGSSRSAASSGKNFQGHMRSELARFGVPTMEAIQPEAISFANTDVSEDPVARNRYADDAKKAAQAEAEIARRTKPWEDRLVKEFPALKQYLSKNAEALEYPGIAEYTESKPPPTSLTGKKVSLDKHLEGLWRWQFDGHPVWLMQLLTIDGSSALGYGVVAMLDGSRRADTSIIYLSHVLSGFWNGNYGSTEHQTRIKPRLFRNGYLVTASVVSGNIAVYDIKTGQAKPLITNVPQRDLIQDVWLSADARFVIQVNSDGQLFLYEVASGQQVLGGRYIDNEILIYTPEGYYWSSYEGAHYVQLRFPGLPGLFTFQQFASVLSSESIIRARLGNAAFAAPPPVLTPPPSLEIRMRERTGAGSEGVVRVRAQSSNGLARIRFFYDGQPARDVPVSGQEFEDEITVPRVPNARWLTAIAVDTKGFVSTSQAVPLQPAPGAANRLHAVLVGVDNYADAKINLRYAKSDARRLGDAVAATKDRYYASKNVNVLLDKGASAQLITEAVEKAVAAAGPQDTILFFFAGHGVQGRDGHYYLTPSGFDLNNIPGTGVSWSKLAAILGGAKSRVVIVLDSCHSGLSGSEGLATNEDTVKDLLSGAHAPVLVLAAAKGRQFSFENPDWGGGIFTYALSEVLKNSAAYDLNRNGVIEVSELYQALRTIVGTKTNDEQTPWLARQDLIGDFVLF